MAVFDATMLLLLFAPDAGVPRDSEGRPIRHVQERIDGLIAALAKAKTKIIIPAPALSELLVRARPEAMAQYLGRINKSKHFLVADFDQRAAIEVALMTRKAIESGDKKDGSAETWAKVKYDRQIVAIAKVNSVSVIYTDDSNLKTFADKNGLRTCGIGDLPIPDEAAQRDWIKQAMEEANADRLSDG